MLYEKKKKFKYKIIYTVFPKLNNWLNIAIIYVGFSTNE